MKRVLSIFNGLRVVLIMESLLEQQRRYHEERERLMDAMTKEMLHPKKVVGLKQGPFVEYLTMNQGFKR